MSKKKNYKPQKSVETNSAVQTTAPTAEFNSYYATQTLSHYFGFICDCKYIHFFNIEAYYDIVQILNMYK